MAIIGARGSGKTALVDLIAQAGKSSAPTLVDQSFLSRAATIVRGATVEATWTDGPDSSTPLDSTPSATPEVHYLTQQFVDRLCSSVGQSDELLEEIKRVVFLAHEPASRLGADNFDGLVELRSNETRLAVEALNQRLDRLSQDLLVERNWYQRQSVLARDLAQVEQDLSKAEKARQELIKPGGRTVRVAYTRLTASISEREQQLQTLGKLVQTLQSLRAEVVRYQHETLPRLLADLQRVYESSGLTDADWSGFRMVFAGKPLETIDERCIEVREKIDEAKQRSGLAPAAAHTAVQLQTCALDALKAALTAVGEQIGADRRNIQRLQRLNNLLETQSAKREQLRKDSERATQSATRIQGIVDERATLYGRFIELIIEQCDILNDLYKPLEGSLSASPSSARKLSLRVVRSVNVDEWARRGEDLLDLRGTRLGPRCASAGRA